LGPRGEGLRIPAWLEIGGPEACRVDAVHDPRRGCTDVDTAGGVRRNAKQGLARLGRELAHALHTTVAHLDAVHAAILPVGDIQLAGVLGDPLDAGIAVTDRSEDARGRPA